jgi:predicted O-methyltransferase YrrM
MTSAFWAELKARFHPSDKLHPESWQHCYETKYCIAKLVQPASILEFGVRAGYSAFAFLSACPQARYLGIDINNDTHGGFLGAIDHAKSILAPFAATIIETSSGDFIRKLPESYWHNADRMGESQQTQFEIVHIDGDHTYEGCLSDLRGAELFQPRAIIVDDVMALPAVHAACATFAFERQSKFIPMTVSDRHYGVMMFIQK